MYENLLTSLKVLLQCSRWLSICCYAVAVQLWVVARAFQCV